MVKKVGWFEKVPGAVCQYKDGLMFEIIVAALAEDKGARELVAKWMEEDGISADMIESAIGWFRGDDMRGINERELSQALAWFGRKIQWGGVQASMACKVFTILGE